MTRIDRVASRAWALRKARNADYGILRYRGRGGTPPDWGGIDCESWLDWDLQARLLVTRRPNGDGMRRQDRGWETMGLATESLERGSLVSGVELV